MGLFDEIARNLREAVEEAQRRSAPQQRPARPKPAAAAPAAAARPVHVTALEQSARGKAQHLAARDATRTMEREAEAKRSGRLLRRRPEHRSAVIQPADPGALRALLSSPKGLQTAILAAEILGPPVSRSRRGSGGRNGMARP